MATTGRTGAGRINGVPLVARRSVGGDAFTPGNRATNGRQAAPASRGKLLGAGTAANAGRFKSANDISLAIDGVTDQLNSMIPSEQGWLVENAAGLINNGSELNFGLGGIDLNGNTFFWVDGIENYHPDRLATITTKPFLGNGGANTLGQLYPGLEQADDLYLPGSTRQLEAARNGVAIGLVKLVNPAKRNGRLRAGSSGWSDALRRYANGAYLADKREMVNLLLQPLMYGFGHIYAKHGVGQSGSDFEVFRDQDSNGTTYLKFAREDAEDRLPAIIQELDGLLREVVTYYNANMKNPDQIEKGRYGSMTFMARNPQLLSDTTGGSPLTAEQAASLTQKAFDAGSARGVLHFRKGKTINTQRLGESAYSMVGPDGQGIVPGQSFNPNAGVCNGRTGPNVSGRATSRVMPDGTILQTGVLGYTTKRKKNHISRARSMTGTQIHAPTYDCGRPVLDYTVNPSRAIYQNGGERSGWEGIGIEEMDLPEGVTLEDIQDEYNDWVANPAKYGTNPAFMNPQGFSARWGFLRKSPEVQERFAGVDLNTAFRDQYQQAQWAATQAQQKGQRA